MPRRKLTIDDFEFSLKNTVQIKTKHAIKKRLASNTVYINFSDNDIKMYKRLTVHTKNVADMDEFITKLDKLLIESSSLTSLAFEKTYLRYKTHECVYNADKCNWYNMLEYNVDDIYSNSNTVLLFIEAINTSQYLNFIRNFYSTYSYILWAHITNIWYPLRPEKLKQNSHCMYVSTTEKDNKPKYPIYIISKGRHELRYTSKYLEWCNIDYKIVVEPQEFHLYSQYINPTKILILPPQYLIDQGSIPARNFVWKHAKESGVDRHWILDDNIHSYRRYHESKKTYLKSGCIFKVVEDYVDRFTNIKMAGHNYTMFGITFNTSLPPLTLNTRIYSSILLSNDIYPEFAWRGKYNEDTDLSLRILKAGYPTVLFNCILADKSGTLTQKGGNTDTIYAEDDAMYKKAESLQLQHPDVTKIIKRFNRVHHFVDYSVFKNLELEFVDKNNFQDDTSVNNYGLVLVKKDVSTLRLGRVGDDDAVLSTRKVGDDEDENDGECMTMTQSVEMEELVQKVNAMQRDIDRLKEFERNMKKWVSSALL